MPSDPAPTPKWVIVMTVAGAVLLSVIGLLVLLAGYGLWKDDAPPQVADRPSEISWTVPSQEGAETEPAPADGKEAAPADQKEAEKQEASEKAEASHDQITAKWPTGPSPRNEALALALLGTGAALLLAGAFAARITSIKLPGGAEFAIAALQQRKAIAAAALGAEAEKTGRTEILKDSEMLSLGVSKLIEQMPLSPPDTQALRALGAYRYGVEPAPASPELEEGARRVLDEIS